MVKKIGIYIGAFDPIHKGHLEFAADALKTHKLDKLYFLVEPSPRHRQGVKAHHHRVNMAILGVAHNPKLGTIVLQTKSSLDDYLKLIQSRFNDHRIALIIPDTALKRFFHLPNLLSHDFTKMNIIVGVSAESPEEVNLRLKLLSETSGLKFSYSCFKAEKMSVNSNEIKKKLRKGIKPDEVSSNVWDYIVTQNLYAPLPNA